MAKNKVAYILFRFPCVTETFIAEEMQKIQDEDVEIVIYSLLSPKKELIQPVSEKLLPLVRTAPGVMHLSLWAAQARYLFKSPKTYFGLLSELMNQPASFGIIYLKRLATFLKSIWIAKDLETRNPRMIQTHFAWLSAAGASIVSQLLNIPFTVTTHAFDIYSVENDLLTLVTSKAARVVTISQFNKQAMLEKNPLLTPDKIKIIHCGVDLSFFSKNKISSTLNAPPQITSIGSLIVKKGHEYLIRACALLKEQGIPFHCVIIGSGFLEGHLKELIRRLDLEKEVELAGPQPQQWVRDRLAASDVFALACVKEEKGGRDGIPVALMEAMATGIPVISTPVSGIPELIDDGKTGLLAAEKDPESLAKGIARLFQDRELRETLRENGFSVVMSQFDIRKNVAQLSRVFKEVIQEYEQ